MNKLNKIPVGTPELRVTETSQPIEPADREIKEVSFAGENVRPTNFGKSIHGYNTNSRESLQQSTVTSANLVRHFAKYREEALSAPVFISHYGRPSHVLLGVENYDKLTQEPAGHSVNKSTNSSPDLLIRLAKWVDQGMILYNHDLEILYANRAAQALCHKGPYELQGHNLLSALPSVAGSLIEVRLRDTLAGHGPSNGEIPSPFSPDTRLRFQCFPIEGNFVLSLRDITEEFERERVPDLTSTILRGIAALGQVGYVGVSLRATIDQVDDFFSGLVQLPQDRLIGVRLGDLITMNKRAEFHEALETVLRGGEADVLKTTLHSNSGDSIGVYMSIVQLRGVYGTEGAIVCATRID